MKAGVTLKSEDVACLWMGMRTNRRQRARASAAEDTTSAQLRLTHRPTAVEVVGEVPPGHYTNREMQIERSKLWVALHEQLAQAVARHLRLPRQ